MRLYMILCQFGKVNNFHSMLYIILRCMIYNYLNLCILSIRMDNFHMYYFVLDNISYYMMYMLYYQNMINIVLGMVYINLLYCCNINSFVGMIGSLLWRAYGEYTELLGIGMRKIREVFSWKYTEFIICYIYFFNFIIIINMYYYIDIVDD